LELIEVMKKTSRPANLVAVNPIGLERAHNFISKPPYERGDKPRFDRGRFKTGTISRNLDPVDWVVTAGELVKVPGARGSILSATWERGNKSDPSPRVTGKIGQDKSYEKLTEAAERPVDVTGPYDEAYIGRFHQKWRGASKSYGDLRRHGKARCCPDIRYAQAACQQGESRLHDKIDKVATARRRQIRRRREAALWRWERDRRQPKRLLYFLKQPRTWIELHCLMKVLAFDWVPESEGGAIRILRENTSKSVNCVSDEAAARSKENDKRGTPKRHRVVFLSRAEELDLARRAKAGDVPARNRLFVAQWPQVASIARKHTTPKADTEDLIQEAYGGVNGDGNPVGLLYALGKLDPEKGVKFSTFARDAIEWAIKDYKRREQKQFMPSLDAPIAPVSDDATTWVERIPDLGAYDEPEEGAKKTRSTRASRSIRNRVNRGRMTAHISPYANGMAPETLDFVAELNAEAARLNTGVVYTGLAHKIEVTGDIQRAANCTSSLGGWFLQRAAKARYFDGEEAALRIVNSQWRKELRKRAKRKPK
jgi:RNA polymerase sigma factor (sigma-70 family)